MSLKETYKDLNAIVSEVDIRTGSGKLDGFDIALKDNFNLEGTLTTASCKYLSNHQSIYTATSVDKLLAEGAHIVAKTSMDELAMGGTNLSAYTGPVGNPFDPTRISGGSSGGSAALVGAKAIRGATGSDTGDSIRKPAAFCGIVGLKPTYGRISRYGVIPYASSLDHVGVFTSNVKDAALLLEVMAGRDDLDMTSLDIEVPNYSELLDMDLNGKRIGLFKSVNDTFTNKEVRSQFNELLTQLKDKGAILVDKTMDLNLLRTLFPTYYMISNAEAVANHANLDGVRYGVSVDGDSLEDTMTKTRSQGFSSNVKKRFVYGAYSLNDENQVEVLDKAKKVRKILVEAYTELFNDVDVLLTIASGQIAPKIENPDTLDLLSDEYLIGENHMVIDNFSGFPSISIPLGKVEKMPIGINISAKKNEDATLLAYAQAMEDIIKWEEK